MISPITQGDTGAPFKPTMTDDSGNSLLVGLLASAISMLWVLSTNPSTTYSPGAHWTIDNNATGAAHYTLQAGDVATSGVWDVYITLQQSGGPQHLDSFQLVIKPTPGQ